MPASAITARAKPVPDPTPGERRVLLAMCAPVLDGDAFTPPASVQAIAGELEDGEGVRIAVRDQGIGVHPRYQRRIFEKFFQVEDPLTRHHGGAGLGLFVASQILEAHGSRIEVVSELGEGAEFSFSLTTVEPKESQATAQAAGAQE